MFGPRPYVFQIADNRGSHTPAKRIIVGAKSLAAMDDQLLISPIDILQPKMSNLAGSKTVNAEKQQYGAISDICW